MVDITLVWVVIIAVGLVSYVLMDGFDLGVGILFPFAPGEQSRDIMMNSVAPVWDGNETWLILGGAGLLAAFPLVYSVFLPALYIGVFLMLAGLIFRGVAFEFRFKASSAKSRRGWNASFAIGSMVAAFAQGAVVGAYIQGFQMDGLNYAGTALDWLTPFTVLTGLGLMAGYALLGATWMILKTEGETQAFAYRVTPWLLGAVLVVFGLVSAITPFIDAKVMERWMGTFEILWVLPALALLAAWQILRSVRRRHEGLPFVSTIALFIFTFLGLIVSKWPYVVPPDYTFWDAASSPDAQLFILIGALFIIPIILGYTAWTYWVFRGKVTADAGYH
ncbi:MULTISPECIES: cytochrome d ubiquinol oxidase subunit II [unclassified Thioalkalivibrio]|uniref:cytochrome d ubiquinol oxidase subunit II n=1 Tax=unclassified Thioalkalivibrio TaxID=2621013 RepID=UPI00037397BD|nr:MULTISPECIES: cytochrome d ubiquinol oxidase subunit II [unclassified Thioalkalivibrio]